MQIKNDKLEFADADILTFTPETQKALAFYTGPNLPPETILISKFNSTVDDAIAAFKAASVQALAPLAAALAVEKDPAKVAQVNLLLDQAKAVVGVPVAIIAIAAAKVKKV